MRSLFFSPGVVNLLTSFKLIGKSFDIVEEKSPETSDFDFKLDLDFTIHYNRGVWRQPSQTDLHSCSQAAADR